MVISVNLGFFQENGRKRSDGQKSSETVNPNQRVLSSTPTHDSNPKFIRVSALVIFHLNFYLQNLCTILMKHEKLIFMITFVFLRFF